MVRGEPVNYATLYQKAIAIVVLLGDLSARSRHITDDSGYYGKVYVGIDDWWFELDPASPPAAVCAERLRNIMRPGFQSLNIARDAERRAELKAEAIAELRAVTRAKARAEADAERARPTVERFAPNICELPAHVRAIVDAAPAEYVEEDRVPTNPDLWSEELERELILYGMPARNYAAWHRVWSRRAMPRLRRGY
jgi:hypothetical protein